MYCRGPDCQRCPARLQCGNHGAQSAAARRGSRVGARADLPAARLSLGFILRRGCRGRVVRAVAGRLRRGRPRDARGVRDVRRAPERYRPFLPLLRLGKALETATILFLFATGAISTGAALPGAYFAAQALGVPAPGLRRRCSRWTSSCWSGSCACARAPSRPVPRERRPPGDHRRRAPVRRGAPRVPRRTILSSSPPPRGISAPWTGTRSPETTLTVANRSMSVVTVTLIPTCDCLAVDPARRAIAPEASASFRISFDPSGEEGEVSRTLVVATDVPGARARSSRSPGRSRVEGMSAGTVDVRRRAAHRRTARSASRSPTGTRRAAGAASGSSTRSCRAWPASWASRSTSRAATFSRPRGTRSSRRPPRRAARPCAASRGCSSATARCCRARRRYGTGSQAALRRRRQSAAAPRRPAAGGAGRPRAAARPGRRAARRDQPLRVHHADLPARLPRAGRPGPPGGAAARRVVHPRGLRHLLRGRPRPARGAPGRRRLPRRLARAALAARRRARGLRRLERARRRCSPPGAGPPR